MISLRQLRERLGVSQGTVAKRLTVPQPDVDTIERTALRLLDVDTVLRYVGALGCRLDMVACHIDGEAFWLGDEEPPRCPQCGLRLAEFAEGLERGWTCLNCEVQS